jgi:hypothetical protein
VLWQVKEILWITRLAVFAPFFESLVCALLRRKSRCERKRQRKASGSRAAATEADARCSCSCSSYTAVTCHFQLQKNRHAERKVLQQRQGLRQARRARAEQALLIVLMIYNKKTLPNMQHKSNLTLRELLLRLARLVVFQARSHCSRLPRTRCLALPGGGGGGRRR